MKKIVIGIIIALLVTCAIVGAVIIFNNNSKKIELDNTVIDQLAQDKEVTDEALPEPIIEEGEMFRITKEYLLPNNNEIVYTCLKVTIAPKNNNSNDYYSPTNIYEIPNFNIDSTYANEVNEQILQKYEKIIDDIIKNQCIDLECEGLKYEFYNDDNIVSLYMETLAEAAESYNSEIYNINPSTGNKISNKELLNICEVSEDNLLSMIQSAMNKEVELFQEAYNTFSTDINLSDRVQQAIDIEGAKELDRHNLFINKNGDLSIYMNTINLIMVGGDEGTYIFNLKTGESKNTESYEEKIAAKKEYTSVFDNVSNLEYTSNIQDDINGKIAILKNGEDEFKTEVRDGYYIYKDNFGNTYSIYAIINIESEFKMMSTDKNSALFKAVITYKDLNYNTKQFEAAVVVNNLDMPSYISVPYNNYTGSTSFTRTFASFYQDAE